jgi:hypothetical protein
MRLVLTKEHTMNAIGKHIGITLLAASALLISSSSPAAAEDETKVAPGQTVFTLVNRLLITPVLNKPPQVSLFGYFPTIGGLPANLFDLRIPGTTPGEKTAYFTLFVDASGALQLDNGAPSPGSVSVAVLPHDGFSIYYHASPDQDWSKPDSFGPLGKDGPMLVATFKSSTGTQTAAGPVSLITQSSVLVYSRDFVFVDGRTYNFARLMPNGFTIHAISSNIPLNPGELAFAGAGSGVAAGER